MFNILGMNPQEPLQHLTKALFEKLLVRALLTDISENIIADDGISSDDGARVQL
jgi:hypothetical protein